jgi:hypothetical protein
MSKVTITVADEPPCEHETVEPLWEEDPDSDLWRCNHCLKRLRSCWTCTGDGVIEDPAGEVQDDVIDCPDCDGVGFFEAKS